jgi:hypothetical protein
MCIMYILYICFFYFLKKSIKIFNKYIKNIKAHQKNGKPKEHRKEPAKTRNKWREPAKPAKNQPFTGKFIFEKKFLKFKNLKKQKILKIKI